MDNDLPFRLPSLLLLFLALCFFGGCAAEAPPRPPRIQTPQRVNGLTVAQVGHELILSFHAPRLATDGRGLTQPIEVELFREITAQGVVRPRALKPWVVIEPQNLTRFERSGEITYRDDLSPQEFTRSAGAIFSFSVVTLTRGFRGHPRRSDNSNIAQTRILDVPPPVDHVQAVQERHAMKLRWSTPQQYLSGIALPRLRGYKIYRRYSHRPELPPVIGQTTSPAYLDTDFQFGTTYLYQVRAVFRQDGYTAETADSSPVEITPAAIFPPLAPRGLTAVFTGKAVELIWKPETGPGIAGYNVYRQAPGMSARRLNLQLLRTPVFSDRGAAPDTQYSYWVTAVGLNHRESKPSPETTVKTR